MLCRYTYFMSHDGPFHWKMHMLPNLACICVEVEQVSNYRNNLTALQNIDLKIIISEITTLDRFNYTIHAFKSFIQARNHVKHHAET
jgi:hypothetical protein